MTRPIHRAALRAGLAGVVFYLMLVQPNHPSALTWRALSLFPLELPALVLGLMAIGTGRAGAVARAAVTAGLVSIAVLKAADFAMVSALSRGFNPVADLALIEAALRLLSGAIGPGLAILAICATAALIAGVVALVWWAAGVWARLAPVGTGARGAVGAAAVLCAGLTLADLGHSRGWGVPFDPPGTTSTSRMALERVHLVRDTLADLEVFRAAAASDPHSETNGLMDLIDRDVVIVFVESYGRTSHDTPLYADLHRATLQAGEARLAEAGLAMASGYLASPTRGGQSWLAHATFANGLWINDQIRYRAALVSGRQTLFHLAARSGFQTAAVMPQITLEWPEAAFMGFDTVLAARDLGYAGLPFNWVTMPDQFTFAALDRLLRDPPGTRPRFIQIATGSSHAPWVPVPRLVDWDRIGDGSVFNDMATAGDAPDVVWRDRDRVRAQYRLAIDYALQTVISYAERHAADPPLIVVIGDHQAAGFVAQDTRMDVPIHVIGPAHLVARTGSFAGFPGLIPPPDAQVLRMDRMRDLFLGAFTSAPLTDDAG